jgi:regulator of RNase E activity RraB
MRNKLVLIILLILPVLIYLIFATATHNSLFLPTISRNNKELPKWKSLDGKPVSLINKITVLGFVGNDILKNEENLFNLNQKIYGKYEGFDDFQLVMIAQEGSDAQVKNLLEKLTRFSDNLSGWKFVFANPNEIQSYYDAFKLHDNLNENLSTTKVIIIDKDKNHRGRKGKNKEGKNEYKESYNTNSAADLHNDMSDDVKIILREYRLALKRNKNQEDFRLHVKK